MVLALFSSFLVMMLLRVPIAACPRGRVRSHAEQLQHEHGAAAHDGIEK